MPLLPNETFRYAFNASAVCMSVATLMSTFEYLSLRKEFRSDGAFSWRIFQRRLPRFPVFAGLGKTVFSMWGSTVLLSVRAAAGFGLLLGVFILNNWLCSLSLALILVTGLLLLYRNPFALEGSDQMCIIVTAGLLVAGMNRSSLAWQMLGFGFIAAEACLAYLAAGVTKAISPVWRDGTALYRILNTTTFGDPAGARLLRGRRILGLVLCWAVIFFETLFPVALILPSKLLVALFAIGILFHLGVAVMMGLNLFLWAYAATYPAVWFCHSHLRQLIAAHLSS